MSAVKAEAGSGHQGGHPRRNDRQPRCGCHRVAGFAGFECQDVSRRIETKTATFSRETVLRRCRQSLSAAPSLELAHIINFRKAKITNVGHASLRLEEIHLDMGD